MILTTADFQLIIERGGPEKIMVRQRAACRLADTEPHSVKVNSRNCKTSCLCVAVRFPNYLPMIRCCCAKLSLELSQSI